MHLDHVFYQQYLASLTINHMYVVYFSRFSVFVFHFVFIFFYHIQFKKLALELPGLYLHFLQIIKKITKAILHTRH